MELYDICFPLLQRQTGKSAQKEKRLSAMKKVKAALEAGVKPDVWKGPSTPLISAVDAGNIELAKLLIEKNASVNIRNENGVGPLHSACFHGAIDTCILLLDKQADPNMPECHDQTPLFFCANTTDM